MSYCRPLHCKYGHPWTEENTLWHRTKGRAPVRRCRECLKDSNNTAARKEYMKWYGVYRKEKKAGRPRPTHCEVCGNEPLKSDQGRAICFDHDHETGVFRGWLCNSCNQVLGRVGDNPRILVALADYLQDKPKTVTRALNR